MMSRAKLIILGTRLYAEEVADLVGDASEFELAGFGENWGRERCRAPFLHRYTHGVRGLARGMDRGEVVRGVVE